MKRSTHQPIATNSNQISNFTYALGIVGGTMYNMLNLVWHWVYGWIEVWCFDPNAKFER